MKLVVKYRKKKYAIGMQDMGAGGLLCASLEVVKGVLKKHPLKI